MSFLETLLVRLRRFGLRRSIAIYLVIVVCLVLAGELLIERMIGNASGDMATPILNALVIAALVGGIVFFLFHGAVEDLERVGLALRESEERFRSLSSLSADWFWETDVEHRLCWIAGGQTMLNFFGSDLAYGRRFWEIPRLVLDPNAYETHLSGLESRKSFHEFELHRSNMDGSGDTYHLISGEPRHDETGQFLGYRGVGRDVTGDRCSERALSSAKERLEQALNSGSLAIWDTNLETQRIFLSSAWFQMLGETAGEQDRSLDEVRGRIHAEDRHAARLASLRAAKGEVPEFGAEVRLKTAAGDWKWVSMSGRVVERDDSGRARRMTGTVVDIDGRKRAERAMADTQARYRTLVELSPDGVLLLSDNRIEYVNRAAAGMIGAASHASLLGRSLTDMIHPDHRKAMLQRSQYLQAGPGVSEFQECLILRYDGSSVLVEVGGVSYLERGRLVVQTVLRDITERVQSRQALAEREQRFRDVVEAAGEYVWETDVEFRYTWLSARVEAVLGHVNADLLGRRPLDFIPLGEARAIEERLKRHSRRGEPFRDLVHRSIAKSGRVIWQSISGVPVFDAVGAVKGYRGTGADITARRQAEERIQFLATRDVLTGLPNRLLLADRADQAILNAGRTRSQIAVLSVHLDRFHLVKDSLGHRVGDAFLRAVAERLLHTLRKDDTLARLEGEKFALLWDGARGVSEIELVAQKILKALAMPVVIEGRSLDASASIGISVYPGDGPDLNELLRNADAAAHASGDEGGNRYRYFSRELNTVAVQRLESTSASVPQALTSRES